MAHLSETQIRAYHQQGWLIPDFRLSSNQTAHLRGVLDELIRMNPDVRPEKLVSAHVEGQSAQGKNTEGVRGSREFLNLAMNPDIIEMVSDVLGQDVILWGCHVFCKPAGDGLETPWHQDGHYWRIRPLATCTVWVALDDSTIENGCLRVVPGSHLDKTVLPHLREDRSDLVLNLRTAADAFNPDEAVDVQLQAGQMSMHDVYMIHGAKVNRSTKRRAGVALRYMPGTSLFDRSLNPADGKTGVSVSFATRPIWLVRGQDQTGKNDFHVGHRDYV
jgi:ectoine hydroxylase-related dioxygenase (phytanoyl-CoA dioxygenase family)